MDIFDDLMPLCHDGLLSAAGQEIVYIADGIATTIAAAVRTGSGFEQSTGDKMAAAFDFRVADIPSSPRVNDVVRWNGIEYAVADSIQLDGFGLATVYCRVLGRLL